jgi:hypothetical protein
MTGIDYEEAFWGGGAEYQELTINFGIMGQKTRPFINGKKGPASNGGSMEKR